MSASFIGIVPSIEMVIFCAVGGRASLIGAVYGTLFVNFGKTFFSETYPELWLFLMGGLFITVVMFFPDGLAGIYSKFAKKSKFLRKFYGSDQPTDPATQKVISADVIDMAPANDAAAEVVNIKGAKA